MKRGSLFALLVAMVVAAGCASESSSVAPKTDPKKMMPNSTSTGAATGTGTGQPASWSGGVTPNAGTMGQNLPTNTLPSMTPTTQPGGMSRGMTNPNYPQ